jgi:uncharacterized membrane protein YfcA
MNIIELVTIGLVSLLVSGLTLFSGFGLGTILMPVFALFYPVPLAIAATALVHFAGNLFKFGLLAKHADWGAVTRFAIPAAIAAVAGAELLHLFDRMPVWATYALGGTSHKVTPVKAVIGIVIVAFALLEVSSRFQKLQVPSRWLPLGGALSGFFGGLSGNQGALRSAFLIKAGLRKEAFVATGVVAAIIVDATRLMVYGLGSVPEQFSKSSALVAPVLVGTVCAFVGAWVGKRLLRKVTLRAVQIVVATAMLVIGTGLATGLV